MFDSQSWLLTGSYYSSTQIVNWTLEVLPWGRVDQHHHRTEWIHTVSKTFLWTLDKVEVGRLGPQVVPCKALRCAGWLSCCSMNHPLQLCEPGAWHVLEERSCQGCSSTLGCSPWDQSVSYCVLVLSLVFLICVTSFTQYLGFFFSWSLDFWWCWPWAGFCLGWSDPISTEPSRGSWAAL